MPHQYDIAPRAAEYVYKFYNNSACLSTGPLPVHIQFTQTSSVSRDLASQCSTV